MLPLLARMLKMAGCRAVSRRRIYNQQHHPSQGPTSSHRAWPSPLFHTASLWPGRALLVLQVLSKLLAYLEAGELGLHVLLLQMQSCLSEEDSQRPQPKEGGDSDDGVDPKRHALR